MALYLWKMQTPLELLVHHPHEIAREDADVT